MNIKKHKKKKTFKWLSDMSELKLEHYLEKHYRKYIIKHWFGLT